MQGIDDPKRPKPTPIPGEPGQQLFYLIGHPSQAKIVDGDHIDVDAVPDGTHSYAGGKVKQFKIIQAFKDPFK